MNTFPSVAWERCDIEGYGPIISDYSSHFPAFWNPWGPCQKQRHKTFAEPFYYLGVLEWKLVVVFPYEDMKTSGAIIFVFPLMPHSAWSLVAELCLIILSFPGGSVVKNLPAMQKMWVWSWVRKIPSRSSEMAPCSSILAWEIPWTEEPSGPQFIGLQRIGYNIETKQQQEY